MSYHVYNTEGIILKRKISGETDTILYVLTKDLGLIIAKAQATRTIQSKLKGSLQEYSLSNISLVKGKNSWKITNASLIKNFYFENKKYAQKIISQVSSVLMKMIPGEDPSKEIYRIVLGGFNALEDTSESNISSLETLLVFRIMKELGYIVLEDRTKKYIVEKNNWATNFLEEVKVDMVKIVEAINKAIKESHL